MADSKKKDAEGPCQISLAPGLGFRGRGQSGVRSCSLVGSLGMTPAQQGGENDPLKRRVDEPREGSLYPPRRSVGIPLGRFPSRFGPPHGFASTCCTLKTPLNLPL
ncbi:hypothetical protein MTP99_017329 [Tenebrio molitor]|nr:hypothetical protein MTP99_017329 [Tenebrio molitor]